MGKVRRSVSVLTCARDAGSLPGVRLWHVGKGQLIEAPRHGLAEELSIGEIQQSVPVCCVLFMLTGPKHDPDTIARSQEVEHLPCCQIGELRSAGVGPE